MHTITIVGGSLAGFSTARALRDQHFAGRIVMVGDEPHAPYDRPPLSKEFLAGTMSARELDLATPEDDALQVRWHLGRTAVALEPANATVVLDDGERIVSDGVVLATGARARSLPGPPRSGVHTVRTLDDAVALRAELVPGARVVIVGAGFVGAEIASTASGLGAQVTLVELGPAPMLEVLGEVLAPACAALHADHGVTLLTGVGVAGLSGEPRVRAVQLADGRELPADVVVVGIGAQPCVRWLAGSGVSVHDGVITGARCATTVPNVVAVGDCASSYRHYTDGVLRLEHWNNAVHQPTLAAATLLGREHTLPARHEVPYFWSDQYGHRLQFAGHRGAGDRVEIVEGSPAERDFVAVYRDATDRPTAVLALNSARPFGRWRRRLADRLTVPA